MFKSLLHRTIILALVLSVSFTGLITTTTHAAYRDMDAVSIAYALLGEEYSKGKSSLKDGFDSSGLIYYIFNQLGYNNLPRALAEQYMYGRAISKLTSLTYGDILFFGQMGKPTFSAIYTGGGKFISSSQSKDEVVERTLTTHFKDQFLGARRVLQTKDITKSKIVITAKKYLGTPYVFGARYGQTRTFDCSSFVKTVFEDAAGITLPRVSRDQAKKGVYVARKNLTVGDLVFFSVPGASRIGHVGIYVGDGQMIHTWGDGGVRFEKLSKNWWDSAYITARRIL